MMTDSKDHEQVAPILVAVYGTLKRGQCNHHVMLGAEYVGDDCLTVITLYDLGPYPGAKVEASEGIDIEVFAVTPAYLAALDILEEYNSRAPQQGMYDRVQVETRFGLAWIYVYNDSVAELVAQRRGAWLPGQAQVLQVGVQRSVHVCSQAYLKPGNQRVCTQTAEGESSKVDGTDNS